MIRRLPHILLEVGLALAFGAILLAGYGAWRLSKGPVSLAFLMPYVDQELAALETPYRLRVKDIVLAWAGWRRPVEILLVGTTARDKDGAVVAELPRIGVGLAFRPLVQGRLAPTALDLIEPSISVVRDEDGRIRLGFGTRGEDSEADSRFDLDALLRNRAPGTPLGWLARASVVDGRLAVEDRRLGIHWSAPRATVAIRRRATGLDGSFDLDARLGGGTTGLKGRFHYGPAGEGMDLAVSFTDLVPKRVAATLGQSVPALARLESLAAPVSGHVTAQLGADGGLEEASFELAVGPGTLVHPSLPKGRLALRSATAHGAVVGGGATVRIDGLEADLGDLRVRTSADLRSVDGAASLTGKADLDPLALGALRSYWPAHAAPGARRWILANLNEGEIEGAHVDFGLRFPAGGGDPEITRADVRLELKKAVVHYFRPLPPIVGVSASVRLTPDRADFEIRRGFLGDLDLSKGKVEITQLSGKTAHLALETEIHGPVRSALALLDHPRLGYAHRLGFAPRTVAGTANVRLRARFPLIAALALEQVTIGATGRLEGLDARAALLGRDVEDGQLDLDVDDAGFEARGRATVAGIPASIGWTERFTDSGPFRRRYDVAARLGEADRARLGIDLAPFVSGPVDVAATYRVAPGGAPSAEARLDLTASDLAFPGLGWRKPAGASGSAKLALAFAGANPAEIRLDELSAPGLEGRAKLTLAPGGRELQRIDVERLVVGGGTDVAGHIELRPGGSLAVTVEGRSLDAVPLIRRLRRNEAAVWPTYEATARLARLIVAPGQTLNDVRLRLDRRDGNMRTVDLEAELASGKPVTIRLATGAAARELTVASGDAGRVLAALGVTQNVREGRLRLTARQAVGGAPGPWRGRMLIGDFVLANAPKLARALRLASLGSISESLGGSGVRFDRLEMPFTYAPPRLQIKDARVLGADLGITGQGTVDVAAETVDLDGSLIPAYTINSLLGKLPAIGPIFSGEKGGGLFGATYTVKGPLAAPKVTVNPLAALAPGFLRGLLRSLGRAGEDAPPEPPPQD